MCQPCPSGTYSHAGHDNCRVWRFPRLLHEDECIWWHLPLVAVGVASLLVAASFVFAAVRRAKHQRLRKKAMKIAEAMDMLYHDLWEESPETVGSYSALLQELGADTLGFPEHVNHMRAEQSQRAGVSMRYILSQSFMNLSVSARKSQTRPSLT